MKPTCKGRYWTIDTRGYIDGNGKYVFMGWALYSNTGGRTYNYMLHEWDRMIAYHRLNQGQIAYVKSEAEARGL